MRPRLIGLYSMFYAQSTVKGYIRAKLNVLLPQVKFRFLVYDAFHVLFMIGEVWGKMKLNELGRQKLGRKSCQQALHINLYSASCAGP